VRLPGRGRLPLKVLLRRLYLAQDNHAALDTAAQLGFYCILSLFPLVFVLTALLAYLPLAHAQAQLLGRIRPLIPLEAMKLVEGRIASLLGTHRPKLLGAGVAVALWAASCGVDSARKALNLAYDVKESRPFWRTQLIAIFSTITAAVFVLLTVGLLIAGGNAGHWLADRLGVDRAFTLALRVVRWPLTSALMMSGTAVAYYLLPDVKQKFWFMLPGAATGTLLWLGASWAFTQYVKHFGSYDVTYGSLAGVVVLLTWIYISAFIFVIGGELNAIIEHAAPHGKHQGARRPREPSPPPFERPSFLPPGAAKKARVGARAPSSSSAGNTRLSNCSEDPAAPGR
jgi:membrane protein